MMASTLEKSKRSRKEVCVLAEDRISNLPSCLIGHILSLLPTKEAVATSVLSKPWEKHWTLVTSLDFNDKITTKHGNESDTLRRQICFEDFVRHVLFQRRPSPLSKFRIECCKSYSDVFFWIYTALKYKVQEIDIFLPMDGTELLPCKLFRSETLVELKLGENFVIELPTSVWLPCLKVLCLHKVMLLHEDSISKLIGGCPLLEELIMSKCIGEKVKVVNISTPSLEYLDFISLSDDGSIKIVLNTPKLVYLFIDDHVAQGYQLKNLGNLYKAGIDLGFKNDADSSIIRESLEGLLKAVSEVKFLELHGPTLEAMSLLNCRLPVFKNVTKLYLGSFEWELLPVLLKNSPFLRTLKITEECEYEDDNEEMQMLPSWVPPENVPDCLLYSLKKIDIKNFRRLPNELAVVEYFLENAKVLEMMVYS